MSSRDDRKDRWEAFFDIMSGVRDIASEHEDDIKSILGNNKTISLEDSEPMPPDVTKTEDVIEIIMEMKMEDGVNNISFRFNDDKNKLIVEGSERSQGFVLPQDCDVDSMSAKFNNGVMTMTIPRESREIDVGVVDKRDGDDGNNGGIE